MSAIDSASKQARNSEVDCMCVCVCGFFFFIHLPKIFG